MNVYYLLFFIVILLSVRNNKFGDIIIPLLLFLLSLLRADSVGTDTSHYMDEYSMYWLSERSLGDIQDNIKYLELLYIGIVKIAYYLETPRLIISFFSFITFLFLFLAFRRFRVNQGIAFSVFLLLSFYIYSLNYARQLTASAILLYSYSFYIIDNDKNKCSLYILLASLVHLSSLFFIFILFIPVCNVKRTFLICIVSALFAFTILSPINIITISAHLISLDYLLRYEDLFMDSNNRSIMGVLFKILNFFILVYLFMKSRKDIYADRFDVFFCLSIVFSMLFDAANPILARICIGIAIIQVPYISKFFSSPKSKRVSIRLLYILFAGLNAYAVLSSIKGGAHEVVPYTTI